MNILFKLGILPRIGFITFIHFISSVQYKKCISQTCCKITECEEMFIAKKPESCYILRAYSWGITKTQKKRYPKDGTTKIERDRNGSALKKGLQQAKLNFSHSRNKLLHVERPFPPFFFYSCTLLGRCIFSEYCVLFRVSLQQLPIAERNVPHKSYFCTKLREGFLSFIYCRTVCAIVHVSFRQRL